MLQLIIGIAVALAPAAQARHSAKTIVRCLDLPLASRREYFWTSTDEIITWVVESKNPQIARVNLNARKVMPIPSVMEPPVTYSFASNTEDGYLAQIIPQNPKTAWSRREIKISALDGRLTKSFNLGMLQWCSNPIWFGTSDDDHVIVIGNEETSAFIAEYGLSHDLPYRLVRRGMFDSAFEYLIRGGQLVSLKHKDDFAYVTGGDDEHEVAILTCRLAGERVSTSVRKLHLPDPFLLLEVTCSGGELVWLLDDLDPGAAAEDRDQRWTFGIWASDLAGRGLHKVCVLQPPSSIGHGQPLYSVPHRLLSTPAKDTISVLWGNDLFIVQLH